MRTGVREFRGVWPSSPWTTPSGIFPIKSRLEVTPHLVEAFDQAPDAPGPLVWIYPFDEYHQWIRPEVGKAREVLFGDLLVRDAVNAGLPLNTVCSTGNFTANPDAVAGRILVSPVPDAGSAWETRLIEHVERGGQLFLYGSLSEANQRFLDLFALSLESEIDGEFAARVAADSFIPPPDFSDGLRFNHSSVYSAGGLRETRGKTPLLTVESEEGARTLAAEATLGEGRIVWFRGSVEHPTPDTRWLDDGHICHNDPPGRFSPARFAASLCQRFGWEFRYSCPEREILEPAMTIHQSQHRLFFCGAAKNALVEYEFRTPLGAPVMLNSDLRIKNGRAVYQFPRGWRRECRVFLKQKEDSIVSCRVLQGRMGSRFLVTGLKDAEVVLAITGGEGTTVTGPAGKPAYELEPMESQILNCVKIKDLVSGNVVIES